MSVSVICDEAAYLDPSNLAARTDDTKRSAIFVPLLAEGFAPGKLYLLYVLGMYAAGQPFTARDLGGPLWKTVKPHSPPKSARSPCRYHKRRCQREQPCQPGQAVCCVLPRPARQHACGRLCRRAC